MQLTATEFAPMLGQPDVVLLDVRTDEELEIVRLDPCVHIPLHELESRVGELDAHKSATVVCMCHHGVRSAMAQSVLLQHGFQDVRNLEGGIHAYADEVDDGLAFY